MTEGSEETNWQPRRSWAKCREPYRTTLNTIASHWLEGAMTHEELAVELWKLRTKRVDEEQSNPSFFRKFKDVDADIQILADAICDAADIGGVPVELDTRRIIFDECIRQARNGPSRPR